MKIFIFTKRRLLIIATTITVLIIFSIIGFVLKIPESFAVEFDRNNMYSKEFGEKIATLTKGEEKIAYLTFDDGPTISTTPKILDILKKEDIKATFFVIGKYVDKHPDIIKRAYLEGHYIANHGYNHDNKRLYMSKDTFKEEVKKTDEAISKAIGITEYCSHVFRFPNGYISPQNKKEKEEAAKILEEMNYTYIDWNCLNNDSIKKYSKEQLLENLKKSSKNKNTLVILMHDTQFVSNSADVLEDSIKYLKSAGYRFENFYDLIK